MADYTATGLWVDNVCAESEKYVSVELAKKLKEWNELFTHAECTYHDDMTIEQQLPFISQGLKLAYAVKKELQKTQYANSTVIFFDPCDITKLSRWGENRYKRNYVIIE